MTAVVFKSDAAGYKTGQEADLDFETAKAYAKAGTVDIIRKFIPVDDVEVAANIATIQRKTVPQEDIDAL